MSIIKEKMKLFQENTVINWHEHVWFKDTWGGTDDTLNLQHCDKLAESMVAMGVDLTVVSNPIVNEQFPTVERIKRANDTVFEAMERHPGVFKGLCFLNPGYIKEALYELDRCYDKGMIGVKLYHQYQLNDPVMYPLIEKCIDMDIPILMHAGHARDGVPNLGQPRISDATYFVEVAKRYPEATFMMAHITGGGDWEWQIRTIVDCPNVITDMSGGVMDRSVVEKTVGILGADRLLFGTDISAGPSIGKILGADISDEDKKTILEGTRMKRFLRLGE